MRWDVLLLALMNLQLIILVCIAVYYIIRENLLFDSEEENRPIGIVKEVYDNNHALVDMGAELPYNIPHDGVA